MHIIFDVGIQEINSEMLDDFGPEEKDIVINDEIKRFVSTRINPKSNVKKEGFEHTKKRLDDLRSLKREMNIPLYIGSEDNMVYSFLPADYRHTISIEPRLTSCISNPLSSQNTAYYLYAYELPTYDYNDFKIETYDGNSYSTVFDAADYTWLAAGLDDDRYKFYIKDFVRDIINENMNGQLEVYYEYFNGQYYPNKVVFVQRSNTFSSLRITANNVTNTYNFTSTQESNFILGSNGVSKKESRLYSSEDISARISDGFTKPTSNSLVAEVFDDTFRLYRPSDVYTNECRFVYLKDPRRVDVNMGINCDISEDFA